ncbi:MAG: helix-turn-helix transcriptional regulator [Pseudomonadota bacterium]
MDEIVSSIREKRKKLKWTIKVLAQKANIPYGTLLRIEKGDKIGMEEYISLIEVALNKALNLPYKKWSQKYDQCTKCGTTLTRHVSRGFCKNCYDRYIEGRHKDVNRLRKYGGSSSLLTKEYLLENYVNNQKSLGDIAKEANCSRQYVHKVIVSHGIPLRSKSCSRDIALSNDKLKFQRRNDDGDIYSVTLKKIHTNENFFSSWSPEMAYVFGNYIHRWKFKSGKDTGVVEK